MIDRVAQGKKSRRDGMAFELSDWIMELAGFKSKFIPAYKVAEFIRLLKKDFKEIAAFHPSPISFNYMVDKRAGDFK